MKIDLKSVIQLLVILTSLAFGYGSLDRRVIENKEHIDRAERELIKRNDDFIENFNSFLTEQRTINRQIVEVTINQKHMISDIEKLKE
ncbi:hypothetical protein AB6D40_022625 [Vibrio cyclitrophicus]|jgi:hypothetical protein